MPYDSPMKKKGSSCMQMKDHKGKPSGLMMEGSVAHQESADQEKKNLLKDMPIDSKASAMEMSPYKMDHESPAKMGHKDSPMHDNHDKDERSGKAKPFMDPGAPEGFESSMGENYDEEEATRIFMGAQKQAQNALNIARQQLEGTDVINQRIKGHGSSSISGPSASQVITGYSTNPEGKVVFNKEAVRDELNKLDKLAITDPVKAKGIISRNISGAPLGDFRSKFMRDVNPLNRPK